LPDRCCEIPGPSTHDTALLPICRSTHLHALRKHVFQENKELLGEKCAQEKYLGRWDLTCSVAEFIRMGMLTY
jgi:hypothetical protein